MEWGIRLSDHEVEHDARIAPGEPVDDAGNEARGEKGAASDPHFANRRIGEKLDALDALVQVVEYCCSAIEQSTAVLGWLDALRVTVKQLHAEDAFKFRNRSGNRRLVAFEVSGSF